jgi:hypothetical protein
MDFRAEMTGADLRLSRNIVHESFYTPAWCLGDHRGVKNP